MFQLHTITPDERERMQSPDAQMPRADARAQGMTTALRPGGGNREWRTSAPELTSDCVVTCANGDTYTIKRSTGGRRGSTNKRARSRETVAQYIDRLNKQQYQITASDLAPIGDSNH